MGCVMITPVLLTVILSNTGPIFKDLFEYRVLPRAAVALLILPFLSVSGSILIYRGKKDIITCTSVCGGDIS